MEVVEILKEEDEEGDECNPTRSLNLYCGFQTLVCRRASVENLYREVVGALVVRAWTPARGGGPGDVRIVLVHGTLPLSIARRSSGSLGLTP